MNLLSLWLGRPGKPMFMVRSLTPFVLLLVTLLAGTIGCNEPSAARPSTPSLGFTEIPGYPSPETWEAASKNQADRASRSFKQLSVRGVPAYNGPLFVADEDFAELRTAEEVARRTIVLWAVELRAEGVPQAEAKAILDKFDVWSSVSPNEKAFLESPSPDPVEAQALVWRLESIWVLLWSLGYIDELKWPAGMCDVPQLVNVMKGIEADTNFIAEAKLRPKAEIIDAQDLTMRIHWAVRDAYLSKAMVPEGLDWSDEKATEVTIESSPSVGVIEQRHYVLNWIANYPQKSDWDNVDTPT